MTHDHLKNHIQNKLGCRRCTIDERGDGTSHTFIIRVSRIPSVEVREDFKTNFLPAGMFVKWEKLPWWKNWFVNYQTIERFE